MSKKIKHLARRFKNLKAAIEKNHETSAELEHELMEMDVISFDFSIYLADATSFVLSDEETGEEAPLQHCLDLIDKEGILTRESFTELTTEIY